jgi:hypothetical protein
MATWAPSGSAEDATILTTVLPPEIQGEGGAIAIQHRSSRTAEFPPESAARLHQVEFERFVGKEKHAEDFVEDAGLPGFARPPLADSAGNA